MCDTCGCNITHGNRHLIEEGGKHAHTSDDHVAIEVLENLLSENDHQAAHNREHFEKHGVLAINLMSSPGSGKTRLLERTIDHLKGRYKIGVIEGDLETENDAQRIRDKGVPAIQITTGTACHLDAHMIHQALHQTPLDELDLLFIENVGNLVCPASFDLGQHLNVTLLSVTEGDDKPAKYPVIFRAADHVLITKSDLLPLLDDFNPDNASQSLQQLAYKNPITLISAKSDQGMDEWLAWLEAQINQTRTNSTELETASL
ncbi:MAG: hydrogenase nickel incorporation protein HypB [Chromatiales bacterium]|nr:hydrogenase nickel incorporation protein HypB [Chromatiales bacterium]